ncbi:protein transport protein SEC16A homolog isoform X2 [Lolium rigidum]|uniref:protein transport protein SEC16A homolog isoform X2 n=1 Tax=Lolium rigidum TaxID=89674 RepID=UPI001F5DB9DD|nr:protein transport protein SEC16A homolog isoform X2 [Lolium rigidum]
MAAAADDLTDADFFDKLVDDDDDGTPAPLPVPVPAKAGQERAALPGVEELVRGVSGLGLADGDEPGPSASAGEAVAPRAAPEGSGRSASGVHTTVKQVQWASFGGDDGGFDPFSDLSGGADEAEAFLGGANQSSGAGTVDHAFSGGNKSLGSPVAASVGASDHGFSGGSQSLAAEVTDQDFFGGSSSLDQTTTGAQLGSGAAVDSTDPRYLESMYPGWKFDDATQQWYQVDAAQVAGYAAAQVDSGSENVQQYGVSYLQNSAQAALETIAEESTTAAAGASEYPANMLFYAEYPGWYFDTNTQEWQSLESYQQAIVTQVNASSAVQDGANHGGIAPSDGVNYNAKQTKDLAVHSQVAQQNGFTNSYCPQNQWQPDAFANSVQPGSVTNSLAGSFYGSDEHAQAESFSSSTNPQVAFSTAETSTSHYGSLQNDYSTIDSQQASYKGFEPSTVYQPSQKVSQSSTGNQGSFKAFEPSTGHHLGENKGFAPSTAYKGFTPSTINQAGTDHHTKGFEPSSGHQAGYMGSQPSTDQQAGYMGSQPSTDHQSSYMGFETSTKQGYGAANGVINTQGFVPMGSMYNSQNQARANTQAHLSNSYLGTDNSMNFSQQQFNGTNASPMQFGYSPQEAMSSAGRPPHALVAFGFGGKLIVMKETSSMATNFNSANQGSSSGTVSLLNLSEVVGDKADASRITDGSALSYFRVLCRQPVPGPLVGGSAATKDVNKWLDEMITWYESSTSEYERGDPRRLLISLLKILCQHYGKLRAPFGSDPSQEDTDGPEMAVTKLFSSCKRSNAHMGDFGSSVRFMKNIPSESQMQAVAQEVQNLLVSGRRKEALLCAQEGQLWGPAVILALQLGDQFYVDTVKKMAHCHFISGSPLRTLCLLIAGQPADVFNVENTNYDTQGASQQPVQPSPNAMLDDWEENLAIITANRTKSDDLVITHLGDCLWKERNEVAAAHSCYLVAELNIDPYSESARLCLIGADHLKCPRTFASPEAIQRTEVYEYTKVLGNSQYILLPFQPYKLIYAYMLAEVGRLADSLRYCQASMKVLKASGRAPELEAWKQLFSSLEDRIRTHQQGGYGTNLAPAKLVGKLFTSLDKSISRMMGTPSAPLPPVPQSTVGDREIYPAPAAAKFVNSQSVMTMSSLVASPSVHSISEMAENNGGASRKIAHNRSVSEPDFGKTPKQGARTDNTQSSASGSGSSRFGWIGSTLQKTMGFVSKSRQAKLGQQNKFYYDEKLKRWVEEGAEIPAEEPPLPPPPTKSSSYQNGMPDYNLNGPASGIHTPNGVAERRSPKHLDHGLGMPPIPPSQNQFSARGRMGVRSRYVDTFNKAGATGAAQSYNKPAAASVTPPTGARFFVPTAAAAPSEQMLSQSAETRGETFHQDESSSSPPAGTSFSSPPPTAQFSAPMSSTIQRYPSMDNIPNPNQAPWMSPGSNNSSLTPRSRAASWSGTYSDQFSATAGARSPEGPMVPSPLMPGRPSHSRSNSNSSVQFNGLTEDLHEVEL